MTVLKWLIVLAAVGYLGGARGAVLRAALVDLPDTADGATHRPPRPAFRKPKSMFSTTADGEKVIVWHVPAKPGHAGRALFPRQWRFPAPGSSAAFATSSLTASGSSRCPIAAMPARAESRASSGLLARRGRGLCLHRGTLRRRPHCRLGLFARQRRRGRAGRRRSRSARLILEAPLHLDRGCRRRGVPVCAGALADEGSVPLRSAHCARHGSAPDHAWRARCHDSDQVLASDCSRSPMSRNNSCGFPKAATTISTIMARSKRPGVSSMLQEADGCRCMAHSACPGFEDVVT